MNKAYKKKKSVVSDISEAERELFLNAFYQDELPTSIEIDKPLTITPDLEPSERELFLNTINQGVTSYDKDEQVRIYGYKALGRLRKKDRIDQKIDLHGMYVKDAVIALLRFIENEKARGSRTLLIIHGKGSGVLKNAVFSLIATNSHIDDFKPALSRHGGDGAIIVRLNKKKA